MTTRAEEIAAEGPYKVIQLTDRLVPTFVLTGPHHVAAFWATRHDAKAEADRLNAAYKQGQQDRWIPVKRILPSAADAVDGDVLTLSPTQINILPWHRLHEPMCPVTHWAPLPPNPEQR